MDRSSDKVDIPILCRQSEDGASLLEETSTDVPAACCEELQDWARVKQPERFRHQPLDTTRPSIRLLKILPQSPKCLVRGELYHTTLSDAYNCLSYRWGDDCPSRKILLNDRIHLVRENLYQFLLIAQSSSELQDPIWVDAICIDQENANEKNHQVQQMAQLYSNAKQVHIWLGPASEHEHQVFVAMAHTAPYRQKRSETVSNSGTLLHFENVSMTHAPLETSDDGIETIAYNPYWLRAWIVQEILLAQRKTVWIGSQHIPWQKFCNYFDPLTQIPTIERDYEQPVFLVNSPLANFVRTNRKQQAKCKQPLRELLQLHSTGLQCSDPRDRVYSLLSLASLQTELSADYMVSVRDVLFAAIDECVVGGCMCSMKALLRLFRDCQAEEHSTGTESSPTRGTFQETNGHRLNPTVRIVDDSWHIYNERFWNIDELFFNGWVLHCLPMRIRFQRSRMGRWAASSCWIVRSSATGSHVESDDLSPLDLGSGAVIVRDPFAGPHSSKGFALSYNFIFRIFELSGGLRHSDSVPVMWTRLQVREEFRGLVSKGTRQATNFDSFVFVSREYRSWTVI